MVKDLVATCPGQMFVRVRVDGNYFATPDLSPIRQMRLQFGGYHSRRTQRDISGRLKERDASTRLHGSYGAPLQS